MTQGDVLRRLAERVDAAQPTALVTVTGGEGSVPREAGAKMLVYPDGGIEGTIGGGRLEAQAILDAQDALRLGRSRAAAYELEPNVLGMYCGGKVSVFIDVFAPALKLLILGGGHVGEKTAALAAFLGIPHRVVDDRSEFATAARFPSAAEVVAGDPASAVRSSIDKDTAVVIVTRCHGFDLRCLVAALGSPAFYVGMIGSRSKTERLFELCRRRGLEPEEPRVHAPIGLDLGGRAPEAIALSILAEIMMVRNGAGGKPLRLSSKEAAR